jgi:hypothetical protein
MQCFALRDAKHHIIYKIFNFIYYSIFVFVPKTSTRA